MPEIRPPVDLETALVAALNARPSMTALVAGKVSTKLPSTFTAENRVRLNRSGGGPTGWPDHIDRALVTFHAYGDTDLDAWAVAAELVVALAELEDAIVAGGVINATERVLGPAWFPDPDAQDAPRYLLEFAISAHPA